MVSATYRPESPGSEERRDAVFGRVLLEINGSPRRLRFEQWAEVLEVGLLAQQHASNLVERVGAQRNHLDGLPTAVEMRRAAIQKEQLKSFAPASEHQPLAPRVPGIEI